MTVQSKQRKAITVQSKQHKAILEAINDEIVENSRLETSCSAQFSGLGNKVTETSYTNIKLPEEVEVQLDSDDLLTIAVWQMEGGARMEVHLEDTYTDVMLTILHITWSLKGMKVKLGVKKE